MPHFWWKSGSEHLWSLSFMDGFVLLWLLYPKLKLDWIKKSPCPMTHLSWNISTFWTNICPLVSLILQGGPKSLEWSHTNVPNETSNIKKKKLFFRHKIAFCAFFRQLQNENCFLKHVFSILLNKSLHKLNCLKKQFHILQQIKNAKKAIFWRKNKFYVKVAGFVRNPF